MLLERVLELGFTIIPSFTEFYRVSMLLEKVWSLVSWFYRVSLSCTELYRVLPSFYAA